MNHSSTPFPRKQTLVSSLILASTLGLSGCGGGTTDGSTSTTGTAETYDVTVERGPVLFSHVIDTAGISANSLGSNVYQFRLAPTYPIRAIGGYIDVDHSGDLSLGDVEMGNLTLEAYAGQKLTLASTLASNSELLATLITLGFTEMQLTQETPSSDMMIAALSDEVYKYCIENSITEPSGISAVDFDGVDGLAEAIKIRMDEYDISALTAAELESILVDDLDDAGDIAPLTDSQAEELNLEPSPLTITQESFADIALSPEQESLLAFSWNEEKMAKDLYFALNEQLLLQGIEIKAFSNVATKSETQHQDVMRGLLETYDLGVNVSTGAVEVGYNGAELEAILPGEFPIADVKVLYDDLWDYGVSGISIAQSSLEAACKVEVVDVEDLTESIVTAGDAYTLVSAFENLRSGSYNHYWAFNDALVKQGVSAGCCVLGEEFCRPDFPRVPKGNQ
jgi:hypothetical protein